MIKKPKKSKKIHKKPTTGQYVELSAIVQELQIAIGMGVNIRDRRLFLVGEVDEELLKEFITAFSVIDSFEAPINITLHTNGGSIEAGFAIYDTIKSSRNDVTIDVVGEANSIGALILQAADRRRMTKNGRMMIHSGKLFIIGENQFKADEMADHAHELKNNNERYYDVLSSASNMSHTDVVKACKKDSYFTSEEALELGFIDEVISYT